MARGKEGKVKIKLPLRLLDTDPAADAALDIFSKMLKTRVQPMAPDAGPVQPVRLQRRRPIVPKDPVVEHMKARGIPLTRENYLALAWPDRFPEDEAEAIADLPDFARDD